MSAGARTPEELDALFEDAFVLNDTAAVSQLFEDGAVLIVGSAGAEARGGGQITQAVSGLWQRGRLYVAAPQRVVQSRRTALVLAEGAISVVRRGSDGYWRFAISLLAVDDATSE